MQTYLHTISPIEHCLLAALSRGLHLDASAERTSPMGLIGLWRDVDFGALLRLARIHAVEGVVWDGLVGLHQDGVIEALPASDEWARRVGEVVQTYDKQLAVVHRLADFYACHNVPMMLLNGYGVSRCYPRPELRPSGDVDLWLYGEQETADALLHNALGVAVLREKSGQSLFRLDGVLVENHHRLPEAEVLGGCCDREVEVAVNQKVEVVRLPDADLGAVYLLRHLAIKFRTKWLKLRHIADWAMYVRAHHVEISWSKVEKSAVRFGFLPFLKALNRVVVDELGADRSWIPAELISQTQDNEFWEELLHPRFPYKLSEDAPWLRRKVFGVMRWKVNRWKRRYAQKRLLTAVNKC